MLPHRVPKSRLVILALILVLFAVRPVRAHPADMFFHEHTLYLSAAGIRATWSIYPGGMLVPLVWSAVDADQNQTVTPAEARVWLESNLAEFSVNLDGTTSLAWCLEEINWPPSLTALLAGDETIAVELSADWPANLTGRHQLILHNHYQESISINWFHLLARDGLTFQTPEQQNGRLQIELSMAAETDPALTPESDTHTAWDSGAPLLPPLVNALNQKVVPAETETSPARDGRPAAILTGLVRSPEFSLRIYLVALVIALVLGALHALTPGHGKTVVAAYLVGARGAAWHAINLGAIVTATHTGSVFVLGLITLFASQYILPTSLMPVLEIGSGLLIVGFGAQLLYRRWRGWRTGSSADHHHHLHHHNDDLHHHDHDHHHDHHQHSHHYHHHHHLPDEVTWRSLLALGVSGGLVPCPDAIAILLVAIAINRIAFGLFLIVAFSLGLALVLIAIGLAMVHSRRLFEKMDAFGRLAPLLPLTSAIIVLGLGLALTINAVTRPETITAAFPTPEQSVSTSSGPVTGQEPEPVPARSTPLDFDIDRAGLLYLAPDERDKNQLFRIDLAGGGPAALTQEAGGVWSYALSPDGRTIAYVSLNDGGAGDIWLMALGENERPERLLCPEELSCSGVVWSPDGRRLIYEALSLSTPDAPGLPTLWWLDVATSETKPVFQDSNWPGYNAGWSPDGQWLSYIYPGNAEIEIYHLADGRRYSLPNPAGKAAVWSPADERVLVTDIVNKESRSPLIHLFRFDLETEILIDLSVQTLVSAPHSFVDMAATWSPDGAWIVLVRQEMDQASATVGSHLWLMRSDGTQARPLTAEPEVVHGTPVWSPDGRHLAFHRYSLSDLAAPPGIWLMNIHTAELREIVPNGRQPTWIPCCERDGAGLSR